MIGPAMALGYPRSSPHGSASISGQASGESSMWIPCPAGRQYAYRTFSGSRPSAGSSNLWPRTEANAGTLLEGSGQVYDRRVTYALYQHSQKNLTFVRATFFTTQLTQLGMLGYNPASPDMQHQGVQLTMASDDMEVPDGAMNKRSRRASVLTLEMVTSGLLTTFRTAELQPSEVHSMEKYEFDRIAPEVIANFLLDHKGESYSEVNCHKFAQNLMERIMAHGQTVNGLSVRYEPRRVTRVVGTADELSTRAWVLLGAGMSLAAAFLAAQFYYICRVCQYFYQATSDSKLGKVRATGGLVYADVLALDAWTLGKLDDRLAQVLRCCIVWYSPILFYIVVGKFCFDNVDRLPFASKIRSKFGEPLLVES